MLFDKFIEPFVVLIFVLLLSVFYTNKTVDRKIEEFKVNITKEIVDSLVGENHNDVLLKYSLQTMREEVDSLRESVWATNRAWLTIYDLISPKPRYDWSDEMTITEVESVMTRPGYKKWNSEMCINNLKKQGVIE